MKYPVAKPDLSKLEKKYLNEAINSGWISSSGNYIDKFESQFAKKCSVDHAIAVSNGTVALHLALMALGIGKGDEVIVPSLTYIASANAVRYVGANPVFCDVSKETWCMTYESIEKVITKRTKCIIVVHLYGNVANMDQVNLLARKRNIKVIEDAAEATFAKFNRKPVGSLSDVATFSFYGNKIITSGEGGALTTNNNDLAKQIRLLKGQGMSDTKRYFFPIIGYNYRMTNICAAILCAQLERVDTLIEKRERINHLYEQNFTKNTKITLRQHEKECQPVNWLFSIILGNEQDRDQLIKFLSENGIETRPFFIPIHSLPPYSEYSHLDLPITNLLSRTGLNLPTYTELSDDDVNFISNKVNEFF